MEQSTATNTLSVASRSPVEVETQQGNSPVKDIPTNYWPEQAQPQWLVLPEGKDAGKKQFFYDVVIGNGEPSATVLFVHGNPESSYTYCKTIDALIEQSPRALRVVAMDHIGFGLSDQASFEMVDMHHAANLKQLISHLNLQNITLVIHDWGGAIGVGALIDSPERVSNIVLMNTSVFPLPFDGWNYTNFPFPGCLSWNRLGSRIPWRLWRFVAPIVMFSEIGAWRLLGRALSVSIRAVLDRLTEDERLYRDMFITQANAVSSRRNVMQTKYFGHGYCYFDKQHGWQDNRQFFANIQRTLPKVWQHIGVKAFFGQWDPLGGEVVQQQWLTALPQLQGHIKTFADRGHFIEEHEYQAIAAGIIEVSEI